MEDEAEAPRPTLPPTEGLQVIPRTVVPAGESEVVAMLAEQARFSDNEEMRGVAKQLLGAGYTVASTARRLGIRATTVWGWSKEPDFVDVIHDGAERRRNVLGRGSRRRPKRRLVRCSRLRRTLAPSLGTG